RGDGRQAGHRCETRRSRSPRAVAVAPVSGVVRDAHDAPERRVGNDAMAVREMIDASVGCAPFSLALPRVVPARGFERRTGLADELLFVLAGAGELITGERHLALEP